MKIALLQCNTVVGDVIGNAERIVAAVRQAGEEGASLCVTPELALCGIAPQELLSSEGFMEGCQKVLQEMALALADAPPVLLGAPVLNPPLSLCRVSNAAVLLQGGTCRVISRKIFSGQGTGNEARYFDRGISCGIVALEGWRLGVVVCEDNWDAASFWKMQHATMHNPLMEMVRRGVDAIVQLAASPFFIGMEETREHLLSHVAARHHVHLFSVNAVGGNDNLVFSGQSLAFDATGRLLGRGKAFAEDLLVVDTALKVEDAIVASSCQSPEEECWRALVLGTGDYVHKSGMKKAVVGLSGGMDSALVCTVAATALGAENVLGVLMPASHTSQDSITDALQLAENLGVTTVTLPIESMMHAFESIFEPVFATLPEEPGDVTFENLQARIRGTLLMSLANRKGALVLNTGNKSESAMGYCTLYGDSVGALAVISDVPKTFVYRIAHWYNQQEGRDVIPQNILSKAPSAELRPGQKDTDSLPPYDVLDPLVERILYTRASAVEENAVSADLLVEVRNKLFSSEFKRRQGPLGIQVSSCPFGTGWQVPAVMRYRVPEAAE